MKSNRGLVAAVALMWSCSEQPTPVEVEAGVSQTSQPVELSVMSNGYQLSTGFGARVTGAVHVPSINPATGGPLYVTGSSVQARGTCGVTFVSPHRAITAAHCVGPIDIPNPQTQSVLVQTFDIASMNPSAIPSHLTGTFPNYSHGTLGPSDGYLVQNLTCSVAVRCGSGTGNFNCPAGSEAGDIVLLSCPDRAASAEYVDVADSDPPVGTAVEVYWAHEIVDMASAPSDAFNHYTVYNGTNPHGENFHYHPNNYLIPLRSTPWASGPRTIVGSWGDEIRTDLFACHGTSGSGVMTTTGGVMKLLGPTRAAGIGWVFPGTTTARLCLDPAQQVPGTWHHSYTKNAYTRALFALAINDREPGYYYPNVGEALPIATVIPVAGAAYADTTVGYYNDYQDAPCGGGGRSPDRVYKFTLNQQQRVQINTFGTSWDTLIWLKNAAGANVNGVNGEPGCNDDSQDENLSYTVQSALDVVLDPGTYYVIVDSYNSNYTGSFDLRVSFPPSTMGRDVSSLTFKWNASAYLFSSEPIVFTINGNVAFTAATAALFPCASGSVGSATVTDPAVLALLHDGANSFALNSQAYIAWAKVTAPGMDDVVIADYWGGGDAVTEQPDMCVAGYGQFGFASTYATGTSVLDRSWKHQLYYKDGSYYYTNTSGWEQPGYVDSPVWTKALDLGSAIAHPTWGTVAGLPATSTTGAVSPTTARWTWWQPVDWNSNTEYTLARKNFIAGRSKYTVTITADNAFWLYVNGAFVGSASNWLVPVSYTVNTTRGTDTSIAILSYNGGGPGGLLVDVR